MAPVKRDANQPPFQKDERVLCFHMDLLYEAKILEVERNTPSTSDGQQGGGGWQFKVHYKGWKSTWDDWVPQDRIKKFTEENKELAAQLAAQQRAAQRASKAGAGSKKGAGAAGGGAGGRQNGGSDFGSARGSEERTSTAVAHSGKSRRARDFELEQVSRFFVIFHYFHYGSIITFYLVSTFII